MATNPQQPNLGGAIFNASPWRNFREFQSDPIVQDRTNAFIQNALSTPAPAPSASLQSSMRANGLATRADPGAPAVTPAHPLAIDFSKYVNGPPMSQPQPGATPQLGDSIDFSKYLNGPLGSSSPAFGGSSPAPANELQSALQRAAYGQNVPTASPSTDVHAALQQAAGLMPNSQPGSSAAPAPPLPDFAQAAGSMPSLPQVPAPNVGFPTQADWLKQNPKMQMQPIGEGGIGRALFMAAAGLTGAAGGMRGDPTAGVKYAQDVRDYNASVPLQNFERYQDAVLKPIQANQAMQQAGAEVANLNANTAHTALENQQLQMVPPWQKNVEQLQDGLQQRWQAADMSPQDYARWAQLQISQNPYGGKLDPGYLQQVMQLPRKTVSVVNDKDDVPTSVKYYNQVVPIATDNNGQPQGYQINGKTLPFNDPSLPKELQQAAPEVMQNWRSYQAKRKDKRDDAAYAAGVAGDRQAAGFANAERMSELHDQQKQNDEGRQAFYKATTDFNTKKGEVDSLKQNVALAMDPKNPNPYAAASTALSLVGISLPPGTKRMTDTELHQFQNQGSAGQRLAAALNGYMVGTKMTPQQAKAINDYADAKMAQHQQDFNNTAANIQNVYGYKPPAQTTPSSSGGSIPASAAGQLREGVEHTFRNGQVWTKKNGQPVRVR